MDNSSHRSTFVNNLLLLGFSPEQSATGLYKHVKFDEDMFTHANNTKAFIATSHFLFTKLDPRRARTTFKDCWPIVDFRRQSRLYIATAFRWLEELRREGQCLSKNVTLRRSYFEDCRGEKVEAIMTSLSMHVLKMTSRTRSQQQSSKSVSTSANKKPTVAMASQRQHKTTCSTQQPVSHKPVSTSSSKEQHEQRRPSTPKTQHHQYPRRTLTVDPHTLQLLKAIEKDKTTPRKDIQSIFLPHHYSTLDMVHQIRSRARTMQRTISAQPNRSPTASLNQPTNIGSSKDSSDGDSSDHTIRPTDQYTSHPQQQNHDSSKRGHLADDSDRSNKRFKATHPRQQSASLEQHSNDQNPSGTTIYYTARDFHSMSLSPESPNISPLRDNHQDDSCDEIVAEVIEEFHVRTPFVDDEDEDYDGVFKLTDGGSEKENSTTMPHVQLPADHSFSWSSSDRQAASDMRHQLSRECSLSPIPFRHDESSMVSPKRLSVTRASTTTNDSFQAPNDENSSPPRPPPPPQFRTANQENDQVVEELPGKPHNMNPFSKVHDTPLSRRITLKSKDNQYQDVYRHAYQHVYQHASRFDTARGGGNAYQYSPTEHLLLDQSKGWSAFRNL